jgi:hypothetical protein
MTLDRRRFLQLTAVGIAASLTSTGCRLDDARSLSRPGLLGILGPERVWQIGSSYRASVPSENNEAALRRALTGARKQGFSLSSMWSDPFRQQIQEDFAAGRTVVIDGWVLSKTEARQAALFSLAPV